MKTQINLRPTDFVKQREFYWPRVALIIFISGLILLVMITFFYLRLTIRNLEGEIIIAEAEVTQKEAAAGEIQALEAEIKSLSEKEILIAEIKESQVLWSEYLPALFRILPEGVNIESILPAGEGLIAVGGSAEKMADVDFFRQRLLQLEFLTAAGIDFYNIDSENTVYYQATLTLKAGDSDEQE